MRRARVFLSLLLLPAFPTLVHAQAADWTARGRGGAVAAGDSRAVAAGIETLRQGGNAADAAAATLLALSVTDFGRFAIGGEVSLLIYDAPTRQVRSLCGLGRAPQDPAAIGWYYEHGIPASGSMLAAPVPGAVDLCVTTLRLYGTKSLAEVIQPTLAILDGGGKDWYGALAVTLRKLVQAEQSTQGTRGQAAGRQRSLLPGGCRRRAATVVHRHRVDVAQRGPRRAPDGRRRTGVG